MANRRMFNLINKVREPHNSSVNKSSTVWDSARTTLRWLLRKLILIMGQGITGSGTVFKSGFYRQYQLLWTFNFCSLYVYISNIPAIATENFCCYFYFCLYTTCFGPYGPTSGETQQHHLYFESAIYTTTDPLFYNCSLLGVEQRIRCGIDSAVTI
jgi:hypothetical protein